MWFGSTGLGLFAITVGLGFVLIRSIVTPDLCGLERLYCPFYCQFYYLALSDCTSLFWLRFAVFFP